MCKRQKMIQLSLPFEEKSEMETQTEASNINHPEVKGKHGVKAEEELIWRSYITNYT